MFSYRFILTGFLTGFLTGSETGSDPNRFLNRVDYRYFGMLRTAAH